MDRVIPSVMAQSPADLRNLLRRLHGVSSTLHLDIVDGKFAPSRSLSFNLELPSSFSYHAHLMTANSQPWLTTYGSKMELCFLHVETISDISPYIASAREYGWRIGLALAPSTPASILKKYLSIIDAALVLTVNPGYYGSPFLPKMLNKVRWLKRWRPGLSVYVDGHINTETISHAAFAGADYFICGSAVSLAKDPRTAKLALESKIDPARNKITNYQ